MRNNRKRLSHHRHTGRILAHQNTNYGTLFGVLVAAAVLIAGVGHSALADDVAVHAVISSPAPTRPPVILKPVNGQSFTSDNSVSVIGNCIGGDLVKIFANEILIGAVFCTSSGSFDVPVSLFNGSNTLVAMQFDALGQQSPPSVPVTVSFGGATVVGAPVALLPAGPPLSDLILLADQKFHGYEVGEQVEWPIEITGGRPPYALNIDWGDGHSDVVSQPTSGTVNFKHVYDKAGAGGHSDFTVVVSASDAAGQNRKLFLTTIIVPKSGLAATLKTPGGRLSLAWPIWISAVFLVISFFLGEQREKYVLRYESRI